MSGGQSEFTKRALTGAAYVALTLGAAIAGPWTTLLLFLPVCVIAAREWHQLTGAGEEDHQGGVEYMVLAATTYLAVGIIPMLKGWTMSHAALVILMMLVFLAHRMMQEGMPGPGVVFSGYMATIGYIALPFSLTTAFLNEGPEPFLGFMFLLWTSDTGAYLVGRAVGRTKLMPAVSPGKTWEGLLGGVALTMLVGWVLSRYWTVLGPAQWMAGAAVVAVTATLGDLLESAFKRARGVKDSGTVLPGHGGIMDRFDGFLLAAPAMLLVIRVLC